MTAAGCEVQFSEGFVHELPTLPRSVTSRLRRVYGRLRDHTLSDPNIKRLQGWQALFRYRLGNHRLVYKLESNRSRCVVTLLYLGHRRDVYRQIGHDPHRGGPTIRVVANERAQPLLTPPRESTKRNGPGSAESRFRAELILVLDALGISGEDRRVLEKCRTGEELLDCGLSPELLEKVADALWPPPLAEIDPPLPERYREVLDRLGVSGDDLTALQECGTESELLDCSVSEELLEKILYALWPRSIDRAVSEPRRVVNSPKGLEQAVDGTRSLESFLLALDDSQRPVVERVTTRPGPWIVKGGPGTGKSTVALHCLHSLVGPDQPDLFSAPSPPRILFTTFTRALVRTSEELLGHLGVDVEGESVDVVNVDALAKRHAESSWAHPVYSAHHKPWKDTVESVVPFLQKHIDGFYWTEEDSEFLFDEMNQVIVGREIGSVDEYVNTKRVGRGRRLGRRQRRHLWRFAVSAWLRLKDHDRCLRTHLFVDAKKHAEPIYDYVFIDEAQDLPPVAIRLCVALAKNKRNVFLTADRNQSIYTSGFSWSEVDAILDMRGRSTILRRNHRTTREIMDAIRPLLAADKRVDVETRDTEFVRSGPRPECRFGVGAEMVGIVPQWFEQVVAEEPGLDMAHAAVLCPTNGDCRQVAKALTASGLSAKYMTREEVSLHHQGIKVMTMHTAKGLQFPIVAVVGLEEGKMPPTDVNNPAQREETDRSRRVFFVACSRAMRRLLVVADKERPSPFVKNLDRERWSIE